MCISDFQNQNNQEYHSNMCVLDYKHTYLNGILGYFGSENQKHTYFNCILDYLGLARSGGSACGAGGAGGFHPNEGQWDEGLRDEVG